MPDEDLSLFGANELPGPTAPASPSRLDLPAYRQRLADLAANGVMIGTSSWKYPGWRGLVYDEGRYLTRGKFSEAKFERECLVEYAETYKTVCVDAGYYTFPTEKYLDGLCSQVPQGFQFAFKVTDDITIRKFPQIPRFGARAGTVNPNFLNSLMFRRLFLDPCSGFKDKIGPLIFEFSTFSKEEFEHGRDFVAALDTFLEGLPKGWLYAVEMRNKSWLVPEYFDTLRRHGVAHCFNNWTRMPAILEQIEMPGSITADFTVARFLLKPGRGYEAAVKQFSPYEDVQEPNDDARKAGKRFVDGHFVLTRNGWVYVNNRLEGNAPTTIGNWINVEPRIRLPRVKGD